MNSLSLEVLPDKLAVCQLDKDRPIPIWLSKSNQFYSITRTCDELSIVCQESIVPDEVKAERGWRVFKVQGPLDFSLTGIMASLTKPLADEEIGVFALSTYDTDYLLVKEEDLQSAKDVLQTFCKIY